MYNPSQAYNAYAESANEINSNLASYRADVDNIKGINKQLVQQAREKTDIDAIRDIASEAGVRAFKSVMSKYGSKLYDAKIPGLGGSIKDADTRLGQAIEDRARPVINDLRARGQNIADNVRNTVNDLRGRGERAVQERVRQLNGGGDPEEDGVEMQEMGAEPGQESANTNIGGREDVNEDGTNMTDDLEDMGDDIDMGEGQFNGTFEDFMNQFDVARKPNGDIDFNTENNRLGMVNEDLEAQAHREQLTQPERPEEQPQQEMNENHEENNNEEPEEEETPNEQFEDEQNDAQDEAEDLNEGEDLQGETADAMEGLGEGAEAGAEAGAGLAEGSGIAEGLEEGAGALAATGIGAPIAGALAVAGGLVEAFTLFESGKGIVDWFEQDVLGQHPKAPQVKIPKLGLTSAERGQMIVPTSDTLDTQLPVGGW